MTRRSNPLGGKDLMRDAAALRPLMKKGASGYKVKVSTDDTTPDFLDSKLAAGANVTLTITDPGGDEAVEIAADVGLGDLHDAVTLGAGSDPILTLSGQELTLGDVATQAELDTHEGAANAHHDPVTIGTGGLSAKLTLSGQELTLAAINHSDLSNVGANDHHDPVTAGDGINLSGQQVSIDVTDIIDTSFGLTESSNNIRIDLATTSGLSFSSGDLQIDDSIAGNGLTISSKMLAVGAGDGIDVAADSVAVDVTDIIGNGLTESSNDIVLGTPGTVSVSSGNTVGASTHAHSVASSASVLSATASLLATDSNGAVAVRRLGVNVSAPTSAAVAAQFKGDASPAYVYVSDSATTAINYVGFGASGDSLFLRAGNNNHVQLNSGGAFLIGDSANSKNLSGLTVNQGSADDELVSGKSSDVAHGMTTLTETDTCFYVTKVNAAGGGASINGLRDSGDTALQLGGIGVSTNTSRSSSGKGAVNILGAVKSGTSGTTIAAGGNVVSVSNWGNTIAIFGGDADLYLDTAINQNAWDDYDDMALLHGLRAAMVPDGHELRRRFGQFMDDARDVLERTGVVTFNDDGHHFVATKRLQMLTIDALRQKHERDTATIERLEQRIAALEAKA